MFTEVTYIYLQGFSPLTLLYMNSGHGEGVAREREGENCNNFLLSSLIQLLNTFMMEGRRWTEKEINDGGLRDKVERKKKSYGGGIA